MKKLGQHITTKTASKLPAAIRAAGTGELDLVLIMHGSDTGVAARTKPFKNLIWDGSQVADKVHNAAGGSLSSVNRIVLWICQSARSGLGKAFRDRMRTLGHNHTVVAPTEDIGSLPRYFDPDNNGGPCPGANSFETIPAARSARR